MDNKYQVILTHVQMENHAEWMENGHFTSYPKDKTYIFVDITFTSLKYDRYQEANGRDMIEEQWKADVSFEELEKLIDAIDYTPSDADVEGESISIREQCECWDDFGEEHWLSVKPIEFIESRYIALLQRIAQAMS